MDLELTIDDPRWDDLSALAEIAFAATFGYLELPAAECGISLLACDDTRIAELNGEFRGKAVATNVLSWPAEDLASEVDGGTPRAPSPDFTGELFLGDIAISYDTCIREADAANKPMRDHVMHLLVHGLLHLLGYDHIRDGDATLMEGLETRILGKLGLDDPYRT